MLYTNRTLRKNIHQSFFGLFQFHLIFLVLQMYFAKHFRQRVDLQQEALTIKIIRPFHHVTNIMPWEILKKLKFYIHEIYGHKI